MQKIGRYLIVTVALVVGAFCLGLVLGKASGRLEIRTEAVKENHGHYRITDNVGSTVFEWGSVPK